MLEALDPLPLLRALHERGVEYVVVGGFALNAHGVIRVTKDLDIVPNPSERNLDSRIWTISGGSPAAEPCLLRPQWPVARDFSSLRLTELEGAEMLTGSSHLSKLIVPASEPPLVICSG